MNCLEARPIIFTGDSRTGELFSGVRDLGEMWKMFFEYVNDIITDLGL